MTSFHLPPQGPAERASDSWFVVAGVSAVALSVAFALGLVALVVLHPWSLLWIGLTVLAVAAFLHRRPAVDEPELDDVHWSAW